MSTETKEKRENHVVDPQLLKGKWKLTYKLVNDKGVAGFSGRQIGHYSDPITGRARILRNSNGAPMSGFMIDKVVQFINPLDDPWNSTLLDWLIAHPAVGIDNSQVRLSEKYLSSKKSNPRITLVNLDHEDIQDLREEDYIDKLVGRISQDSGINAISLKELRFILSALDLNYREDKYRENRTIEKQKLRSRLKTHVRASYENAENVNNILDNLENARKDYEIKEMVRVGILNVSNGMFKYETNPLSMSVDGVKKYFENNPDFYSELISKLYKELKES